MSWTENRVNAELEAVEEEIIEDINGFAQGLAADCSLSEFRRITYITNRKLRVT